jgi:hypothetical protein
LRSVRFGGSAGGHDLRIVKDESGAKTGLTFAFGVAEDCDIAAAAKTLTSKGIATTVSKSTQGPVLTMTDPDGFPITFSKLPN